MVAFTKPTTVNEVWASAGIISAPTNLKITQGWTVEIPPYQYFNWSQNRIDSFIAHVNQFGISQWDNTTEYQAGKSLVQGSDGTVYRALTTNTNKLPSTNPSDWVVAFENYGVVAPVQTQLNTLQNNYNTLANLTNYAQARTNLGVYSKVESDVRFAALSGVNTQRFKVATAVDVDEAVPLGQINTLLNNASTTVTGVTRYGTQSEIAQGTLDNVAVSAKTGKDNYLMRSNNLSDLSNTTSARNNLGLTSTATTPISDILTKAGNLSGLSSISTARSNLGLGTIAVENAIDWLSKSGNLAGLANTSTARNNLGLGDSSTRNVGTTVGTVAAGDDIRIVNAVQTSRTITAGNGLTGGGSLANNVTLNLGTPSTISATSSNSVGSASHSHAFNINSFFGDRNLAEEGWYTFPGGFTIQWGAVYSIPTDGVKYQTFPKAFDAVWQVIGSKRNHTPVEGDGNSCGAYAANNTTLVAFNDSNRYANSISYVAFGYCNV